jgi:SAM-dependent methyltransferase
MYDRLCDTAYRLTRATLLPNLRNSQYDYRDALRTELKRNGTWIDLGCGHDFLPLWFGQDARELDTTRWTVAGLDLDVESLGRHAGLRHRVMGSAECLPFATGSASLITANMVVEHLAEPSNFFREVSRVLQPGGRALLHTPNSKGYTTRLSRSIPGPLVKPLAKWLLSRAPEDVYPTHYRANTCADISVGARNAGLRMINCSLLDSSPQFYRVPPLMFGEVLLMRMAAVDKLAILRPCLLVTLEKVDE